MYSLELGMTSYPLSEHRDHLSLGKKRLLEEKFSKFVFFLLWFSLLSLKSSHAYSCPTSVFLSLTCPLVLLSQTQRHSAPGPKVTVSWSPGSSAASCCRVSDLCHLVVYITVRTHTKLQSWAPDTYG